MSDRASPPSAEPSPTPPGPRAPSPTPTSAPVHNANPCYTHTCTHTSNNTTPTHTCAQRLTFPLPGSSKKQFNTVVNMPKLYFSRGFCQIIITTRNIFLSHHTDAASSVTFDLHLHKVTASYCTSCTSLLIFSCFSRSCISSFSMASFSSYSYSFLFLRSPASVSVFEDFFLCFCFFSFPFCSSHSRIACNTAGFV